MDIHETLVSAVAATTIVEDQFWHIDGSVHWGVACSPVGGPYNAFTRYNSKEEAIAALPEKVRGSNWTPLTGFQGTLTKI